MPLAPAAPLAHAEDRAWKKCAGSCRRWRADAVNGAQSTSERQASRARGQCGAHGSKKSGWYTSMSNEVRPVVAIACSSAGVSFKPAHRRTATRAACDCCGARKLRASWSASGSAQRSCSSSTTCKPTQLTGDGTDCCPLFTRSKCRGDPSQCARRSYGATEVRYRGRQYRMQPLLAAPLSRVRCGQKRQRARLASSTPASTAISAKCAPAPQPLTIHALAAPAATQKTQHSRPRPTAPHPQRRRPHAACHTLCTTFCPALALACHPRRACALLRSIAASSAETCASLTTWNSFCAMHCKCTVWLAFGSAARCAVGIVGSNYPIPSIHRRTAGGTGRQCVPCVLRAASSRAQPRAASARLRPSGSLKPQAPIAARPDQGRAESEWPQWPRTYLQPQHRHP